MARDSFLSFRLRGHNLSIQNLERYRRKMKGDVDEALQASAAVVQSEARRLILQGPKTGKIYIKRGGKIAHRASAPGEPPASDTGTLVRNIIVTADSVANVVKVVAHTNYSLFLEQGTRRMRPRPFMITALMNSLPTIRKIFQAKLGRRGSVNVD